MSLRTLRKNLDKLENVGLVIRDVDPLKRPPAVYYRLAVSRFSTNPVIMVEVSKTLDEISDIISKGNIRLLEPTLRTYAWRLASTLISILHCSVVEEPYRFKIAKKLKGEALEKHLDQFRIDAHNLADELLDLQLRTFVHELLDVALINHDVSVDTLLNTKIELMTRVEDEENALKMTLSQVKEGKL